MEISYTHAQSQRVLKQRNLLVIVAGVLGSLCAIQPILASQLVVNSSGVSRQYLELVTRDTAVLTLDRSPANLEYWMKSVLDITAPSAQGKIRADLMKIVNEQRGSSIAQFFTIQTMELDTKNLRSTVTGDLHTIVGNKVVSSERRSFRFDWQYSGLSLKLVGFGMVTTGKEKDQ
jgi:conjugal transfer pilus assembly protein TraE